MRTSNLGWMAGTALAMVSGAGAQPGQWTSEQRNGRLEARRGEALMLAWQITPLVRPVGGEKFQASAFLHPLCTPAGFQWTASQPADHLHHFGLWWPWKFIEVDGARYNCWEIQQGQGAHIARSVHSVAGGPDSLAWEFHNEVVIQKAGAPPLTVICETAQVTLAVDGTDAEVLDIGLRQHAAGSPVTICNYRYSGFSWRGPAAWNKDTSRLLTSEGLGRDSANGTPARWVVVSGPTPNGSASVLLMSAALDLAGVPEKLRVWDTTNQNGQAFVNFNPVADQPLPLDGVHPAVSNRQYRVVAADRLIDAAAAEAAWRQWRGK